MAKIDVDRCPSCKGAKELMSLGMRMLKCKACDGLGYVPRKVEEIKKTRKVKDGCTAHTITE